MRPKTRLGTLLETSKEGFLVRKPCMKSKLPLATFQVHRFKAIADTQIIEFSPLTALIGNNGSGKSSVIEALSTLQALVENGLEAAMQAWKGFENIWNKSRSPVLNSLPDRSGI